MSPLIFECDYTCAACSRTTCATTDPSPGEIDGLCGDCWMTSEEGE
jgi:hypothetical protein